MHWLQTRYQPCAFVKPFCITRQLIKAHVQPLSQSGALVPELDISPALRVSQRIAASRALESSRRLRGSRTAADGEDGAPLFVDPYAELLATWPAGGSSTPRPQPTAPFITPVPEVSELDAVQDIIATAHVDRLLLSATALSAVNRITQGDYRQVVLLGDGLDTRPLRLPLPSGTVVFMLAPAEVHAVAEVALASASAADIAEAVAAEAAAAAGPPAVEREGLPAIRRRGPRPPPGCVLRRVAVDLQGGDVSLLPAALEASGFRPDRLSVWAVQGLQGLGLGGQGVLSLLAEAAHCAAYHSLLVGELPTMGLRQANNTLADCGLLGAALAFGTPDTSYGRWRPEWSLQVDPETPQRWLFAAQQIRLSAAQMETYAAHTAAAADLDEDFFDNFS